MKFRNDNLFYIKMLVRIIGDFDLIFLSYRLFKSGQSYSILLKYNAKLINAEASRTRDDPQSAAYHGGI